MGKDGIDRDHGERTNESDNQGQSLRDCRTSACWSVGHLAPDTERHRYASGRNKERRRNDKDGMVETAIKRPTVTEEIPTKTAEAGKLAAAPAPNAWMNPDSHLIANCRSHANDSNKRTQPHRQKHCYTLCRDLLLGRRLAGDRLTRTEDQ